MAVNEAFVAKLEILYKKRRELNVLEAARATAFSTAGQAIAAKQGEVTTAEQAVTAAAK